MRIKIPFTKLVLLITIIDPKRTVVCDLIKDLMDRREYDLAGRLIIELNSNKK